MKRKNFIVAMLMICMFLLCSCEGNNAPDGMKSITVQNEYSNDVVDFTLFVPDSWKPTIYTGIVCAKADDNSSVSVIASELSGTTTYELCWEDKKADLQLSFTDFKLLDSDTLTVAGCDAGSYIYTATVAGVLCKYEQAYFISHGTLYIVTLTSTEDNFNSHTDEFKKMLENFAFDKTQAPEGMKAAVLSGDRIISTPGYTIYVPKDWMVDDSTGVICTRLSNSYPTNVTVLTDSVGSDIKPADYWNNNLETLKSTFSDFELINDECTSSTIENEAGDKYGAQTYVYTATVKRTTNKDSENVAENSYKFSQVLCNYGGTMYIITYTSSNSYYDKHLDYFKNILEYFSFK